MHIEGSPTSARELMRNRHDALNIEAVVCDPRHVEPGTVVDNFMYSDAPPNYCRGPVPMLTPDTRRNCEQMHSGSGTGRSFSEYLVTSSCTPMRTLFATFQLDHVNLLVGHL